MWSVPFTQSCKKSCLHYPFASLTLLLNIILWSHFMFLLTGFIYNVTIEEELNTSVPKYRLFKLSSFLRVKAKHCHKTGHSCIICHHIVFCHPICLPSPGTSRFTWQAASASFFLSESHSLGAHQLLSLAPHLPSMQAGVRPLEQRSQWLRSTMIYCSVITSLSEQPCDSIPSARTGRVGGTALGGAALVV